MTKSGKRILDFRDGQGIAAPGMMALSMTPFRCLSVAVVLAAAAIALSLPVGTAPAADSWKKGAKGKGKGKAKPPAAKVPAGEAGGWAKGVPGPAPVVPPPEKPPEGAIEVKVLVLDFDPKIPDEGGKRLTEVSGWNDPRKLAEGYMADVQASSGGFVRFRIVEWLDIDGFHPKSDGFAYTAATFRACQKSGKGWHQPDGADYPKTFEQYGVLPRIDEGEIDEVWFFGGPYFGYSESAMAGPGAFYINGDTYDKVPSKRPFAIMGFNYERGVECMLEDLGHRTEATMSRCFGGWEAAKLVHDWARFAANAKQSNGVAACGSVHYPPNGESDYDYGNKRVVESSADDWLAYPNLTGAKKKVNCETWGGPDYHRNYLKWWFARLPRANGKSPEGRENNWWNYVFRFGRYDERGKGRTE